MKYTLQPYSGPPRATSARSEEEKCSIRYIIETAKQQIRYAMSLLQGTHHMEVNWPERRLGWNRKPLKG